MKTTIIMIALLAALTGCGKREEPPAPVQQPQPVQEQASNCWTGTIILIEADYTVFETPTDATGHKARRARSGKWGQVGDTFDYCE